MRALSENVDRHSEQGMLHFTRYSQPWWLAGNNLMVTTEDGSDVQEVKDLKVLPSPATHATGENVERNSQVELVGHSVVLTSPLYSDPRYGGLLASYGSKALAPNLYGMYHGRIPLPFRMDDEPVYVNAKQYRGILRRRQLRAKAELENKLAKTRKPYLHESRHQHAMRRPRGSGGRFLNTKKLDNKESDISAEKSTSSSMDLSAQSVNSPSSQCYAGGAGSVNSSGDMLDLSVSSNGNSDSNGLSSVHHLDTHNYRDCIGDWKETIFLDGGPHMGLQNSWLKYIHNTVQREPSYCGRFSGNSFLAAFTF